ncbi:hypothetical protein [Pedobacter sp. Leaf176]|uniref:hypothetical protein n=1 Tax=Pedobacter sp. Leaf176 TaxID=1736286 RepID=UPI00070100D3|nr:hypothetical protein [Pedobacter sp. Leaf176]KQR65215.1 hypothetical protein ASF92_19970 [Pedobacter sp. Leaf176]
MSKQENKQENSPVEGQDFADPKEELNDKPSSHGEVANQKGSDFSELEESRMDNPPKERDTNGSENSGTDTHANTQNQENGIT